MSYLHMVYPGHCNEILANDSIVFVLLKSTISLVTLLLFVVVKSTINLVNTVFVLLKSTVNSVFLYVCYPQKYL